MKTVSEQAYEQLSSKSKRVDTPKPIQETLSIPKGITHPCHYRAYVQSDELTRFQGKAFARSSCGSDCAILIDGVTGRGVGMRHSSRCHNHSNQIMKVAGVVYGD